MNGARVRGCDGSRVQRCEGASGIRRFAAGLAVAIGLTLPAGAHHSHGNYADTFIDLEGVVKEVHLVTPHSWVYIEVKNASGTPQTWALEATSAAGLQRIGVTRDTLKGGQTVKARCHPLRDNSRGCLLGFLKQPDGTIKDWDGNNLPIPTDF